MCMYRGYQIDGTSDPQTKMAYAKLQPHYVRDLCAICRAQNNKPNVKVYAIYACLCICHLRAPNDYIYTPSTFTCTCTCIYIYICIYIYVCVCLCISIYIYIYIHIRMECHVVPRLAAPLFPSCPFCFLFSLSFL